MTMRQKQSPAIGHGLARPDQHDFPLGIGKTERQHFGAHRPDLARREIDHGSNLAPDQILQRIMFGDLRRRALDADRVAEIDRQLERRLARFGKGVGSGDRADADVDLEKIVECDRFGGGRGNVVRHVHQKFTS